MPSGAYQSFRYNIVDVDRLINSHAALSGTGLGKRGLGHITRSGVVMLCASWELYLEQLLLESARYYTKRLELPSELPKDVQKSISRHVKSSKHELKPLQLSGDGWKGVYLDYVRAGTGKLNTPKTSNVNTMYGDLLGDPKLSACWAIGEAAIDGFVTVRGDIAHRGRHAAYIPIWQLQQYRNNIYVAAVDTDNHISDFLRAITPGNRKPWRITH